MQRKYSSMYGGLLFFIYLLFIQDADMSCNNTDLDRCECNDGYYGGKCDIPCSQNCKSDNGSVRCNRRTGQCSTECNHGWCYNNCTTQCSTNCKNSSCLIYSCECRSCENGYYGDYCEKRCENCSTCDQETGNSTCEAPRSENPPNGSTTEGNPVVNLRSFGCGMLSCAIFSTIICAFVRFIILDYILTCRCRKCRGTQKPRQQETLPLNQQETLPLNQQETQAVNQQGIQAVNQQGTQAVNQQETQEPSHEQTTKDHAQRSLCTKHCMEHCVYYFVMILAGVIGLVLASCGYRS